jgi:glycolate oxidase FAD binding subunit
MSSDQTLTLVDAVARCFENGSPLSIRGGNTKAFYGGPQSGEPLEISGHAGIVSYEPTELVISARGGTLISEIDSVLRAHQQMLAFEPPRFGARATLGGTIGCGLSGPRRPFAGSVRDFVLGTRIVNGRGEDLRFGGQVMKNVAGYDVSRLMVGSMGTLGVVLEASLKVLPAPRMECTVVLEADRAQALALQRRWSRKSSPISAICHWGTQLHVRLSGSETGVRSAKSDIGGTVLEDGAGFWARLREHEHEFFAAATGQLWRLAVPPASPDPELEGDSLMEWSGALRWVVTAEPAERVRSAAAEAGGHATLFRGADGEPDVFQRLDDGLRKLHERTKRAFDPKGILGPGRMYKGL